MSGQRIESRDFGDEIGERQESFNITVYTIIDGESTLVGLYSQAQIASGRRKNQASCCHSSRRSWELLVIVDEDQRIWELNEEDNIFSKKYSAPEEMNLMLTWEQVAAFWSFLQYSSFFANVLMEN